MSKQRLLPQYDLKELEIMQIESNILCDQIKLKSLKKLILFGIINQNVLKKLTKLFKIEKLLIY